MSENKLFAVCLGGRADGCNTELHDIVFVVSPTIEEAYPTLSRKWFGNSKRLHLDAHLELKYVDGFEINLLPLKDEDTQEGENKLYFINFGAYDTRYLTEIHQSGFYVATEPMYAVQKAKQALGLCEGLFQLHVDDKLDVDELINEDGEGDVDDLIELSEVDGYRIVLTPTDKTQSLETTCGYRKISV